MTSKDPRPERRRRRQDREKLQRELKKAEDVLSNLRKKVNDEFIEKAPATIVTEMKLKLENQERIVREQEERISSL